MKKEYSAGIIVFYEEEKKDREYLLLHYARGHWDFSKGHLENQETHEQAALRELEEETGLNAKIIPGFKEEIHYFLTDPTTKKPVYKTVYFFVARVFVTKIILSREHQDYRWLNFEQALDFLTYENAKEVLQKVESFLSR